jgi:hypothetical protein
MVSSWRRAMRRAPTSTRSSLTWRLSSRGERPRRGAQKAALRAAGAGDASRCKAHPDETHWRPTVVLDINGLGDSSQARACISRSFCHAILVRSSSSFAVAALPDDALNPHGC